MGTSGVHITVDVLPGSSRLSDAAMEFCCGTCSVPPRGVSVFHRLQRRDDHGNLQCTHVCMCFVWWGDWNGGHW